MLVRFVIYNHFANGKLKSIDFIQASQSCRPRSTFHRLPTGDPCLLLPVVNDWEGLPHRIRLVQEPVSYPVMLV